MLHRPLAPAILPNAFRIDSFDQPLASRMDAPEWQRILAFRNHPRFINALFRYNELIPDYFANNPILNKVVTEIWRFHSLIFTLHLCDTRDPDDPKSGLTVSRLQKVCAEQNMASPGRVLALLGIMQLGGYLRRQRSEVDSRIVHLEATDKLMKVVEGWTRAMLQIVDAVEPGDKLADCHARHPMFGRLLRRRGALVVLGGWRALDPFPEVLHFLSRDAAWMLLIRFAAESMRQGRDGELAPVAVELDSFGKLYGVSRSHLRRVLDTAHEAGLLDLPARNGSCILPSHKLMAAYLACMASEVGRCQQWALAVKADLAMA